MTSCSVFSCWAGGRAGRSECGVGVKLCFPQEMMPSVLEKIDQAEDEVEKVPPVPKTSLTIGVS